MNECDELLLATASRKKKRGSGFRFSSKKVFDRFRLKRLATARGCKVSSVTRTLSYPSLIPNENCYSDIPISVATPFESPHLVSIDEFEEERRENTNVDHFIDCEYPNTVCIHNWFILCLFVSVNIPMQYAFSTSLPYVYLLV